MMGLRVEDVVNNAISNVFDTMTESKVKKTEKAFAAFLDNAAKSNVTSQDYLSSNGVVPSSENADLSKTDTNDSPKADSKLDSSKKEIKTSEDVSSKDMSEEEVSVDELQLVAEIEEAIKSMVAEQLGVSIEEIETVLDELDISAIDLLQGNNLLEVVMQVKEIDDMSAVLTDEGLMNQVRELTEEIDFVVRDVLDEHGINKEVLPEIVEYVKTVDENEVVKTTTIKNDDNVNVSDNKETQAATVVVESTKTEDTGNDTYSSNYSSNNGDSNNKSNNNNNYNNSSNNNIPIESHGLQQNQAAQIIDGLADAQVSYTSVDMEEIVNQVVEQIKVQVTEQSASMEMQLNPESYGKLQLQVVVRDGVVTAQMAVENEAVKNALEAQVVQLREEMNNQGVKVEAIEVTVASHEFERNLQQEENASEQAFEEAQSKAARQRMNLNLSMEDLTAEEVENMSDAEVLERKIMLESGNRMSIQV